MPLPIFLPLMIKGAIVAAKVLSSKQAVFWAGKAVVTSVKTYGLATTATTIGSGLTVVGFGVWSYEQIDRAKSALKHFDNGDYMKSAKEITAIYNSFKSVTSNDFHEHFLSWKESGQSLSSPEFFRLIDDLREVVHEARKHPDIS